MEGNGEFVYEYRMVLILVELILAIVYDELGNVDQVIGGLCQLQSLPIDDVGQEGEASMGHGGRESQSGVTDGYCIIGQVGVLNARTIQYPAFSWWQGLDEMV